MLKGIWVTFIGFLKRVLTTLSPNIMDSKSKKLSVLYIVSIMPPYQGGAAVDYGILINTLGEKHERHFEEIRVLTEKGCSKKYHEKIKIHDILFRYDSVNSKEKRFLKQLVNYLIILFYVVFTKKDIIHIHARYVYAKYIGKVVWFALLISPSKVFIDIRDRFYNNFGNLHHFLVCSSELMEYYSWIKKKDYRPVPIEFPVIDKHKKPKHQIAFFGAIALNKGVMELLNGYREYLQESANPLALHFYGQNPIGEGFEKEIRDIQLANYCGIISNKQVFDKIMDYKAIVLPSLSEGMPRICIEAMYCNRLVICHKNIKSIASLIPGEFVLKNLDPQEFKRIFMLIESYDGAVSYNYDFSIHSPDKVSKGLIDIYMAD